jgi:tripartite ATP-independent transporter DctM subunit
VVIGIMAAPAMIKSKYNARLSAGVITAGGTLGILIPPSVMLVVIGPVVGVSVVKLYWAAIVPGLILSTIFCSYALIKCHIWPELGPPVPIEERMTSKRQILKELITGVIPISCIILAALGTIVAGMATPTEAAAMASTGALVVTIIYRKLTWAILKESALTTLQTVSMILFLATAGNIFGAVFTRLGTSAMIAKAMLDLPLPPMGILAVLMFGIFLLGWPLEWPAIVFIFLPIFLPVVEAMKLDPLWFSALVAVNLQTAFLSPPVAMAAYYLKSVAPEWELSDIYKGMAEFMVLQMIGLAIVFFFPEVALWLPRILTR